MELSVDNFLTPISWLGYLEMYPSDTSMILKFGIAKSEKFQAYKDEQSGSRTLSKD